MKKLIETKDLRKVFGEKSIVGFFLAPALMKLMKLDKINKLYDKVADFEGRECLEAFLAEMRITYDTPSLDLANLPKEGSFITVSNHAYGALDGIILMHLVSEERPDLKVIVNYLLSRIRPLQNFFLPVNAFDKNVSSRSSIAGIRLAKECLQKGNPLGLFPAGEVSHIGPSGLVEDIPWHTAIVKFIMNAGVPVVPIYFEGHNSVRFLRRAKIHPMLQTASLPAEVLNKKGRRLSVRVGSPISVAEQQRYTDYKELGDYLRARTYALAANIENKDKFKEPEHAAPIAPPKKHELAVREVEQLPSRNCLFDINNFAAYFAPYSLIPNLMYEIGRKREEAFRTVGEGTYQPLDLDTFDRNYYHLVLWDSEKKAIVGAYRIGMGAELMKRFGVMGFYNNTLFKFGPGLEPILWQSMELGRAFISQEYRYETIPMLLLFKGLFHIMLRNEEYRYFIGPVSISSWYPKLYQSLIYKYIMEHHSTMDYQGCIGARNPFTPDFGLVDPDVLLRDIQTPEQLDRLLMRMSNRQYRLPSLVKRYLKLNSKIVLFNIDKEFNDSLDGFIVCDVLEIPKEELMMVTKDISDFSIIEKRFGKPLTR
ncbi:MAG TPA: lysophospholipid acyltransferase family protein [Bacteroidales bacterium]|nr:MAG: Acyltransferase [Bacteroidetes bacterium ADurb.Bin139]HOG24637.1 lysophospholipid acyltransferase family protein [Bacteroidales bacterium]HOR11405.1 lysophospholipid acyltransferase family protein [Bacteroidales bacterium]HOZ18883.1 lysophospholipid acyltransferase family protein [Bacteroidales bacterium]HPB77598.1 lysophospholipid acyltransferase family protein [Bacteroidales bacterium]